MMSHMFYGLTSRGAGSVELAYLDYERVPKMSQGHPQHRNLLIYLIACKFNQDLSILEQSPLSFVLHSVSIRRRLCIFLPDLDLILFYNHF